jgi:hypothetical protein
MRKPPFLLGITFLLALCFQTMVINEFDNLEVLKCNFEYLWLLIAVLNYKELSLYKPLEVYQEFSF